MPGRDRHRTLVLVVAGLLAGCSGSEERGAGTSPGSGSEPAQVTGTRTGGVAFVGFDASESLINALAQGKIQGLVVHR